MLAVSGFERVSGKALYGTPFIWPDYKQALTPPTPQATGPPRPAYWLQSIVYLHNQGKASKYPPPHIRQALKPCQPPTYLA